ncbi:MAG TPA: hypothetical protein VGE39_13105, partial [Prosthecobacter sp.]
RRANTDAPDAPEELPEIRQLFAHRERKRGSFEEIGNAHAHLERTKPHIFSKIYNKREFWHLNL